jgi:hypothetical protein
MTDQPTLSAEVASLQGGAEAMREAAAKVADDLLSLGGVAYQIREKIRALPLPETTPDPRDAAIAILTALIAEARPYAVMREADDVVARMDRALEGREGGGARDVGHSDPRLAMCMGVGDGGGKLFVYGDYDSIKAAQRGVIERGEQRATIARLYAELEAARETISRLQAVRQDDEARLGLRMVQDQRNAAQVEVASLHADLKAARQALEPFAKAADQPLITTEKWADDDDIYDWMMVDVSVGDLRRARTALAKLSAKGGVR